MRILHLTFMETSGFHDQEVRTFQTNYSSGLQEDILATTEHGRRVSKATLSKHASRLIAPAGANFKARIDNGWGSGRMRWVAVIEVENRQRSSEYLYVTGYTDHNDVDVQGDEVLIPNDVRMYINSLTTVSLLDMEYDGSVVQQPKLEQHDQVIHNGTFRSKRDAHHVRPVDIFRHAHMDNDLALVAGMDGSTDDYRNQNFSEVSNRVSSFQTPLSLSSRRNNSSTDYLRRSLESYRNAATESGGTGFDDNEGETIFGAVDRLTENDLSSQRLVEELSLETDFQRNGYVEYGEFMNLDPDFQDEDVRHRSYDPRIDMDCEDSDPTRGDTPAAIAAATLFYSLPQLMLRCNYSRIDDLVINTLVPPQDPRHHLTTPYPLMDDIDVEAELDRFDDEMEYMILPDMTRGNVLDIVATCSVDIDGVIDLEIEVDGEFRKYFQPVFADGRLPPVLSDKLERTDEISNDILSIAKDLQVARDSSIPTHRTRVDKSPFGRRNDEPRRSRRSERGERSERNSRSERTERGNSARTGTPVKLV